MPGHSRKSRGSVKLSRAHKFDKQLEANGVHNAFARGYFKTCLLAACDRVQQNEDIKAQHGPVRIIMKDGVRVEPEKA